MKDQKRIIGPLAKIIGGIVFLGVFALNVMLFVKADNKGLSVASLKAYATVECGYVCPSYGNQCPLYSTASPSPIPAQCPLHQVALVPMDPSTCTPPAGGEEEEEVGPGEANDKFDHMESTYYDVLKCSSCCLINPTRVGSKWESHSNNTCVGTGSFVCSGPLGDNVIGLSCR